MPEPPLTLISTRREQMFPTLEPAEVDRLRRFGEVRHFDAGAALVRLGEAGHGLTIILFGYVNVSRRRESASPEPIVTHKAGSSWASSRSSPGARRSSMRMRPAPSRRC